MQRLQTTEKTTKLSLCVYIKMSTIHRCPVLTSWQLLFSPHKWGSNWCQNFEFQSPRELDLWPVNEVMWSVMSFLAAKFQLSMQFRSRLRVSHGTDRQTVRQTEPETHTDRQTTAIITLWSQANTITMYVYFWSPGSCDTPHICKHEWTSHTLSVDTHRVLTIDERVDMTHDVH